MTIILLLVSAYLQQYNLCQSFGAASYCIPLCSLQAQAPKEKKDRKAKYSEMDPSEKVVEPNKVFVQNLTWETTEEELVAAFCPVADVISVEIRQVRYLLVVTRGDYMCAIF